MVASLGSVLAPAALSAQMSAMHSRPAPLQSSTSSLGCLTPFSAQRRSQQLRASRIKTVVTTAGYKVHHIYLPHRLCRFIVAARLSRPLVHAPIEQGHSCCSQRHACLQALMLRQCGHMLRVRCWDAAV